MSDIFRQQKFQRVPHRPPSALDYLPVKEKERVNLEDSKVLIFHSRVYSRQFPRADLMSECSYFVVDMETIADTFLFLAENIEKLPNSGHYYFFLGQSDQTSSQQSRVLFSHHFFRKVETFHLSSKSHVTGVASLGFECSSMPVNKRWNCLCSR